MLPKRAAKRLERRAVLPVRFVPMTDMSQRAEPEGPGPKAGRCLTVFTWPMPEVMCWRLPNTFGFATSSVVKLTVQQIAVWGDNSYGQTNMPPGLTNVIAIGANFYNNIVLRSDGTLTVWGNLNGIYVPTNSIASITSSKFRRATTTSWH